MSPHTTYHSHNHHAIQVLVRLRETRLCIEFGAGGQRGRVVRECKESEGTFDELRAAGAPPAEVRIWEWVVCVLRENMFIHSC